MRDNPDKIVRNLGFQSVDSRKTKNSDEEKFRAFLSGVLTTLQYSQFMFSRNLQL